MKKILVILGGGRPKGNTRQLVDAFAQGASTILLCFQIYPSFTPTRCLIDFITN